jgi:acylphosphatase
MVLSDGQIARRLRITGRVQGVAYRAWTVETARRLGLNGWVRNRSDGSVAALPDGPVAAVEDLIERCRHGPSMARVEDVAVEEAQGIVANGFVQKPTV